jgi:hypothetical protein
MIGAGFYFAAERQWWLAAIVAVPGIALAVLVDTPTILGRNRAGRAVKDGG